MMMANFFSLNEHEPRWDRLMEEFDEEEAREMDKDSITEFDYSKWLMIFMICTVGVAMGLFL